MPTHFSRRAILLALVAWTVALVWTVAAAQTPPSPMTQHPAPSPMTQPLGAVALAQAAPAPSPVKAAMETFEQARAASAGCISCHTNTDEASMHPSATVT